MADHPARVLPLSQRWRSYLSRGLRALREGSYAQAAEAFERALKDAPGEPQVLLALGRERMRQGRYDEAECLLRRAFEGDRESTGAAAALARLLGLHQHRREEAFEIIRQALAGSTEPAALEVIRGELLLEEASFVEARAAFELAIDDPISGDAARVGLARSYNQEGISLSESGEYEPAIFAFKRAADLDPSWSGPHVNLGVVFGRMGKTGKAVEAYTAALERDPDNPVAYYNLGTAQHQLGLHKEAVWAFEELLLLAPDYPHVRAALANVLGELREFDRAIALLLEELDIDSACPSCWSSLGLAYVCTGNAERGEQCLLRALQLDPTYFNAIRNLVSLYLAQKRRQAAEEILRQAFAIDPERTTRLLASDPKLEGLRHVELGSLA